MEVNYCCIHLLKDMKGSMFVCVVYGTSLFSLIVIS